MRCRGDLWSHIRFKKLTRIFDVFRIRQPQGIHLVLRLLTLYQSQINRPMCASGLSPKGTMHHREKVVFFTRFALQADLRAISPKGMCAGTKQESEITTLSYTGELISVQINRGFARTHVWNMSIDVHLSLRGCSQ